MRFLWTALVATSATVHALQIDLSDPQSIKDAASQTAHGSMLWYAGNQTGGIPGAFPEKWWEGSALFMSLLFYWHYTGDSYYNAEVSKGMQWQAGDGDYLPANYSTYLGNDDQFFWGCAAMTAAEFKFPEVDGGYSWLSLAQGVFNNQITRWETADCGGGLRWQMFLYQGGYTMKNSISNGGLFQLAARLARYTNNDTYAEWAEKVWDWSVDSLLINNKTWNIGDSMSINDGCTTLGNDQWSYNYGVYLTGAAYMYNYTEKAVWKNAVDNILDQIFAKFFPTKYGGNIMSETLCEPVELCNYNEILFKGIVATWMTLVALIVPDTYDKIYPKLQASAQAAALSCSGMNNNTCGVRWIESKWDGWVGMEEQIIATDILSVALVSQQTQAPLTSTTGGNSTSNPSAGTGDKTVGTGTNTPKPITTGDRAGAAILTAVFAVGWIGVVYWLMFGG